MKCQNRTQYALILLEVAVLVYISNTIAHWVRLRMDGKSMAIANTAVLWQNNSGTPILVWPGESPPMDAKRAFLSDIIIETQCVSQWYIHISNQVSIKYNKPPDILNTLSSNFQKALIDALESTYFGNIYMLRERNISTIQVRNAIKSPTLSYSFIDWISVTARAVVLTLRIIAMGIVLMCIYRIKKHSAHSTRSCKCCGYSTEGLRMCQCPECGSPIDI